MSRFPRDDYRPLERYEPDRRPIAVDLSDNTNRWGPHPAALEVLQQATADGLTRYPSVYADDLRRAVARRFDVSASCVGTGCGSDDLLDSTFRAVSPTGGTVRYPDPTFSMIPIFARMNGLEAVPLDWREARDDPERLLETDPDLIYVCSPNNPTGAAVPENWIDVLLEAGGSEGPVVVLDEAYADFSDHSELERAPQTDRLLVLRTFSKAYGLAGLRIGFAVGPEPVVSELEKSRGPYKVGRLDEEVAVRALEESDWVDDIVDRTLENRSRLVEALEGRGFSPRPSRANFVLLPLKRLGAAEVTARLRSRGVAVRPFPDLPGIGEAVRISIGPWRLLEQFLEALDAVLPPSETGGAMKDSDDGGNAGADVEQERKS